MKATNETKAAFAAAIAAIRAAAEQNPEYPGKIKNIQRGKPEDRAVFRIPAPQSKGMIVSCEPWRQCINALADKLEKNARFFGGVRPTLKVSKVGDASGLTAARSAHAEGHHRAAARALGDRLIFTIREERNPTFQPYCKSATCEVSGVEYSIGFAVFGKRKTMLVIHEPTGQFISAGHLGHPRTEAEAIVALQSESRSKIMRSIADDISAGKHPAFDQASELAEYLEADTLETLSTEPIAEPEATEATVTEGEHSAESFGYLEEMPCAPFQAPRRPAIEGYPTETIAAIVTDALEKIGDTDTEECEDGDTVTVAVARTAGNASATIAGHAAASRPTLDQAAEDALLAALGVAAPALDPAALYAKAGAVLGTPKKSRATKASEPKTRVYQCYSDPGHGWARVPMSDIIALGIANKITPYSYMRGSWAYLEEDCDASTLVRACEAQGIAVTFKSHATCDRPSSIRNYDSYRSPVPPDAVAAQALETDESDCDDSDCATIAAPAAPKLRARWNGSTWIQDSPPDDGGNSPPNAGMPTGEAGEGAGEDSPLESITIMREAYARFISDEHNRNWLQSLRDELDGCAFPLPLPDDCEPAPYGDRHEFKQCGIKSSVRTNHMCLSM